MKRLTGQTSRIIAVGRGVLAVAFLFALWIDPAVSMRETHVTNLLIAIYLFWATALIVVAAKSWWFDYRLAPIAQGVDIAMFVTAIYLTESPFSEFQSPFLALAAFLLISAMVRWNWKATVITALLLLAANLALAAVLHYAQLEITPFRLVRRIFYMLLLSGILIWLSVSRGGGRPLLLAEPPALLGTEKISERRARLIGWLLQQVSSMLGAGKVALAIAPSEEPWVELWQSNANGTATVLRGPAKYAGDLTRQQPIRLFQQDKARALFLLNEEIVAAKGVAPSGLATFLGVDEGVIAPVESAIGSGQLLVWDMKMPSTDSLPVAGSLARQIGNALDREEMAVLARNAAEARVRHALARDLHDSVAQFLAGTLFRLEALRRWSREGNDPEPEIDAIKSALRREQGQLRQLIDNLRKGKDTDRHTEIADELQDLMAEAGAHWHIETRLLLPDGPLPVSVTLSHEIRQLVREGVANAVRHGKCRRVTVSLAAADGQLQLGIHDDGTGFPAISDAPRPRSIAERVDALGGTMHIHTSDAGTDLRIALRSGDFE